MGVAVPTASVRPATEHDVAFIAQIAQAAAAALHETRGADLLLRRESPPPDADHIARWLHDGAYALRVGTLDDFPVAGGIARLEVLPGGTRLAVVTMLWVDEAARSLGVGEALLSELSQWARGAGCSAIDAYALPGERITKNFFEAAGFKARLLTVSHRLDDPTP